MDINVELLDVAYDQCADLHSTITTEGNDLVGMLKANITSLKSHWISSDATAHINNLIDLYTALCKLLTSSSRSICFATEQIVKMQILRRMNGGGSGNVDSDLSPISDYDSISHIDDFSGYQVDVGALMLDKKVLEDIIGYYNSFVTKFEQQKDSLLSNWKNGAKRAEAVKNFNDFLDFSDMYKNYLQNAFDNLSKAASNVSSVS